MPRGRAPRPRPPDLCAVFDARPFPGTRALLALGSPPSWRYQENAPAKQGLGGSFTQHVDRPAVADMGAAGVGLSRGWSPWTSDDAAQPVASGCRHRDSRRQHPAPIRSVRAASRGATYQDNSIRTGRRAAWSRPSPPGVPSANESQSSAVPDRPLRKSGLTRSPFPRSWRSSSAGVAGRGRRS